MTIFHPKKSFKINGLFFRLSVVPFYFVSPLDFTGFFTDARGMYIRRTKTKSLDNGEAYYTFRIVESVRLENKVKQRTLLNLGKDFAIAPEHWPLLTARIKQLLQGSPPQQQELFELADDLSQLLESTAHRYSALITAKLAQPIDVATPAQDYHGVDINHIETAQARSIGVETLALHAAMLLQLDQKLAALGFNQV